MKLLKTMFLSAVLALALAPALAACTPNNTIIVSGNPGATPSTTATAVNSAPLPAPGRNAPGIALTALDGAAMNLSAFRGQPVLVNFFATWCGPCREEMPYLQAVEENQEFRDAGFRLLEVNIQETPATVRQFMLDNGLDMTVLLDTDAAAAQAYNVNGIPASFFIDRNGIIQKVKIGAYSNLDDLERDVQSLIDSQ